MNTRGMNRDTRELIREAEGEGWSWEYTSGGHLKLTHPDAATPVFCASTPGDYRSVENTRGDMRRALRGEPTVVREIDPARIAELAREAAGEPPPESPLNGPRRRLLELGWCDGAPDREAQVRALTDAEVRRFTREARMAQEQAQDAPDAPGGPEPDDATQRPSGDPERPDGVWCVYNWDAAPYVVALFAAGDELHALRRAVGDRAQVAFVPFGEDVDDVLQNR